MSACPSKKKIRNLFHDCGSIYVSTIEPAIDEPLTVRLRTEKGNVTRACVEYSTDGIEWNAAEMELEKEDKTGYYEFFIGIIPGQKKMYKYRFRVGNEDPENEVYYSRTRIGKEAPVFDEKSIKTDNCWCMIPGYHAPDWAKGVIWYSAMPDAFYNGDITNDEPISGMNLSNSWNMMQHSLQYKYGGDLKGIEKKLNYIKDLGCEAVFMDPIFRASQNAGYGPEFYKQIENSFGNEQALAELAKAIHDNGMYYMLDVVLMFVAVSHYWYDKYNRDPFPGAKQEWDSPYHDFFYFEGEEGDTDVYKSGWGGLILNHANEKLQDELWRSEDSYLQHYCKEPFCPDGLRFDCGGALSGTYSDGTEISDAQVMRLMRPSLRKINPEILILSEYSLYYGMDTGAWDSRWNLQFVGNALPYMKGEVPESELFKLFDEEMHNLPRAIGHCQYNSIADHDRPRMAGVEPWAYRAYQLIHMTEIGAPCIYYGDENRTLRSKENVRSFYAMEWNEAIWDYDALYQTKALTELRKRYPVLRQGIIKYICADDKQHMLAFARMDEESTVITVASRNSQTCSVMIDVRDLGELDGTIFTDWFTAKQYVTENGYICVDVQAGGTIFVKGEASTFYKGGFELVGNACANEISVPDTNAFQINTTDGFLSRDVFNTCTISANYADQGGAGMLQIRADNSEGADWIGAEIRGDMATVSVKCHGQETVAASRKVAKGARIVVSRNADNTFDVCAVNLHGTVGVLCNTDVKAFDVIAARNRLEACDVIAKGITLDMPNHAKAVICVKEGTALFENVAVEYEKETILCSDFREGHSAMFDFTPDMELTYGENGLTVLPKKDSARLLTNAYNDDWTYKAELAFAGKAEGDFAGVISQQEDDIYVAAGRMYMDGQQRLVFGRASAGKFVVYHVAEDERPDEHVTVQLQRIGTAYSAIYSYDGMTWKMLGRDIVANMCVERAGLIVLGKTPAVYTYASFGDAIHDGVSYRTPHTPIRIETDFAPMRQTMLQPAYRIVSGTWDYANEGYVQTSKELAQMGVSNKIYRDLKVDGTYVIDEGTGWIGFEFGKKAYDSELGDGILFRLSSERVVSIEKQGEVLAQAILSEKYGNAVKLAVEYRHGVLVVFAGQEGEPVLVLRNMERTEGSISYYMEGIVGHINNYLTASYDAGYYYSADYEPLDFSEKGVKKSWLKTKGFLSPFGIAVTDFVATVKFTVDNWGNNGRAGFIMASSEAKFVRNHALKISCGAGGDAKILNGEEVVFHGKLPQEGNTHTLMLVRNNGKITVYADQETEPCMQYPCVVVNGGVVSLFADGATVTFEDFTLADLAVGDKPEEAKNYKEWKTIT